MPGPIILAIEDRKTTKRIIHLQTDLDEYTAWCGQHCVGDKVYWTSLRNVSTCHDCNTTHDQVHNKQGDK